MPSMTFTDLKAELAARGFSHLTDTEQGRYVNFARAELDGLYLWPYLEKSVTGVAPLAISDLGIVEAVTNETQDYPLKSGDFRSLLEWYGDLSITGLPEWFYVAWSGGTPQVATYQTNTDTIGVQYWKVSVDLSAGSDVPLAPTRFHDVYVDLAERRAALRSGKSSQAQAAQVEAERKVGVMVDSLLGGQQVVGAAEYQQMLGASCDG